MTLTIGSLRINLSLRGLSTDVLPSFKSNVVENIERENSYEYRHQVASYHFVNHVIDDILADPEWYEIAKNAVKSKGSY